MATQQAAATRQVDILIVGAGIAGSALACALRGKGLRVCLLDKSDTPLDTARGDHLQPYTCAVLERWGVLERFTAAGAERRLGAIWYDVDGEELLRFSVADLDLAHPYFLYINHEEIDRILLDAALEDTNISVVRPIRNCWFDRDESGRFLTRVAPVEGDEMQIASTVVIGADGRNSRVRKAFGFAARSTRYQRPIAVVFARPRTVDPAHNLLVYLRPDNTLSVIPRTGGGCKLGIPIAAADAGHWRGADTAALAQRLADLLPHFAVDAPRFADVYAPVRVQAERWVQGRVALLGDACHAMHPARSQGMNVAIRCIDVLAGQLAAAGTPLLPAAAEAALQRFEGACKPAIDAILEKNHQAGLQMDAADAASAQRTRDWLRSVQADPEALQRYALGAAGYS